MFSSRAQCLVYIMLKNSRPPLGRSNEKRSLRKQLNIMTDLAKVSCIQLLGLGGRAMYCCRNKAPLHFLHVCYILSLLFLYYHLHTSVGHNEYNVLVLVHMYISWCKRRQSKQCKYLTRNRLNRKWADYTYQSCIYLFNKELSSVVIDNSLLVKKFNSISNGSFVIIESNAGDNQILRKIVWANLLLLLTLLL